MPRKKIEIKKQKAITVSGKRKMAIAKATIKEGQGITINSKPISSFNYFQQLSLREPIKIAENILGDNLNKVNIKIQIHGGGSESQIEASRLAIARAIVAWFKEPSLKTAFLKYDRMLLVADTRRKEMRKPNDSKARAARQKSYR
jgi:small subunit ribosomal protein S9